MNDDILCSFCDASGTLKSSKETNKVGSNVRYFQNEFFTVWRCPSCHSLHSLEQVDLDHYYSHYPLQQHTLDFWARIAYHNRLKRLCKEGLNLNQSVLDYGCGQGLFVTFLREKGYDKAFGYDAFVDRFNSEECLKEAYDSVNAQDVIEHAVDPLEMMNILANLLKPGGLLYVGTPNADRINLNEPDKFSLSLHQPYHRHLLSEEALVRLGERNGLKVVRVYHRWYYDTLFPTVNHRFLQTYIERAGNVLDVAFEDPKILMVMTSPKLLYYALFGYFYPPLTEMTVLFRKV